MKGKKKKNYSNVYHGQEKCIKRDDGGAREIP